VPVQAVAPRASVSVANQEMREQHANTGQAARHGSPACRRPQYRRRRRLGAFNPFAWQLMFVLGILCRVQPVPQGFHVSDAARWLTRLALTAVLAFAIVKLFVLTQPLPGQLKQNLSVHRVINFVAIAWLAARFVHSGGIARLARKMPAVVTVGRTGLVCFVTGTLVSLIVDTATPHALHDFAGMVAAFSGELVAITAMLIIARGWNDWKAHLSRAAVNGAGCG
jgi:hypothetical protein